VSYYTVYLILLVGLNQGWDFNILIHVALPEGGTKGCHNIEEEVRNKWKLLKKVIQLVFLHQG
jgi:hypothetical protein